jgi:hypothetical protein
MTAFDGLFHGFRPFLRKELSEWWQRRAAAITFAVVAGLGLIGTLATRIDEALGGVPEAGTLDPTMNVLGAKFEDWILFAAIFASIGILARERATAPSRGRSPSPSRGRRCCSPSGALRCSCWRSSPSSCRS